MTPHDPSESDIATLRALHREASDRLDVPPNPAVRAAVLAEAAKAIARDTKARPGNPFGAGRWPLSMAAVLVVSVMAGLVATRTMRDEPERVAPIVAAAAPPTSASNEAAPTGAAEPERSAPPIRASADRVASASIDDARARVPRPKVVQPVAAPSRPAPPPAESQATASMRQSASFAERLDAAPAPVPEPVPAPAASAPGQAAFADATLRRSLAQKASSEPSTPEAWVERIVSLRVAGRADEADRELAALRLRYPDFAIPQGAIGSR